MVNPPPAGREPWRLAIHDVLQTHLPEGEACEGGVLVGWVVVAEILAPDGEIYLASCRSERTPRWTARGMLHSLLEEDWPAHAVHEQAARDD